MFFVVEVFLIERDVYLAITSCVPEKNNHIYQWVATREGLLECCDMECCLLLPKCEYI